MAINGTLHYVLTLLILFPDSSSLLYSDSGFDLILFVVLC